MEQKKKKRRGCGGGWGDKAKVDMEKWDVAQVALT